MSSWLEKIRKKDFTHTKKAGDGGKVSEGCKFYSMYFIFYYIATCSLLTSLISDLESMPQYGLQFLLIIPTTLPVGFNIFSLTAVLSWDVKIKVKIFSYLSCKDNETISLQN